MGTTLRCPGQIFTFLFTFFYFFHRRNNIEMVRASAFCFCLLKTFQPNAPLQHPKKGLLTFLSTSIGLDCIDACVAFEK